MSNRLESALGSYLALTRKEFERGKEESRSTGGLRILLREEELLLRSVGSLEQSNEFGDLAKTTAEAYRHEDAEPRVGGKWESHTKDFFRLSGLYLDLFKGQAPPLSEVVERYQAALRTESHIVKYLAPLEFIEFSEEIVDCTSFQIRRFSEQELDTIIQNPVKRIFYKWAYVNSAEISQYWFLYLTETAPAKELGKVMFHFDARVQISYSQYPQPVQDAIARLALYNWGSNPVGPRPSKAVQSRYAEWDGPFRPHIPFVISCSNSMVEWPRQSPDLSVLVKEPFIDSATGEESGEIPLRALSLNEGETKEFQAFMQHCGSMVAKLDPCQTQWGFVGTALGFLVKGFTAEGLEQILWHITAIEAVLGQKVEAGLTKLLLTRVSKVLGRTKEDRKEIYKRFDRLYSFRSDLVHGNAGLATKEIYLGHLSEARDFARSVLLWMVGYLCHVVEHLPGGALDVPSREDLLTLLDMDTESRRHTSGVLQSLPANFPNVEGWL